MRMLRGSKFGVAIGMYLALLVLPAWGEVNKSDYELMISMGRPYYNGSILPTPRKVTYSNQSILLADPETNQLHGELKVDYGGKARELIHRMVNERINRFKEKTSRPDAYKLSEKVFPIRFLLMGDPEAQECAEKWGMLSDIADLPDQGYAMKINHNGVLCIARKPNGLVSAAASLVQLMGVRNGKLFLQCVEVVDWPEFVERYINLYEFPIEMHRTLDFLAAYKINGLTLGYPIVRWGGLTQQQRHELSKLKDYMDESEYFLLKVHIHIGPRGGLTPLDCGNQSHVNALIKTVEELVAKWGVHHISILMDDVPNHLHGVEEKKKFQTPGQAQVHVMTQLVNRLKESGLAAQISFLTPYYATQYINRGIRRDGQKHVERYFNDLKAMPKNVWIVWTGPKVCSRKITDEDISEYRKWITTDRSLMYYDNNVQFHRPMPNLYARFPSSFADKCAGKAVHINVLPRQDTLKYFTATTADYFWNPDDFEVERSWRTAARQIISPKPEIETILKRFYDIRGDDYQVSFDKSVYLGNYREVLQTLASMSTISMESDSRAYFERACKAQAKGSGKN